MKTLGTHLRRKVFHSTPSTEREPIFRDIVISQGLSGVVVQKSAFRPAFCDVSWSRTLVVEVGGTDG